jgi:NADH-quinone oxidoreductase subunit N
LIVASASLVVLIIETIFPKSYSSKAETSIFYFSMAALIAATIFGFFELNKNLLLFSGYIRISPLSATLNLTVIFGALLTVLSSREYLEGEGINYGEYYSLFLMSVTGMILMIAANDLIILFVGLELMSVCFYILAGFMRRKLESNESALKYFLLGAFLTGFLLLGIAFLYGYSGTTNYTNFSTLALYKGHFYFLGVVLVFAAFIFKTGSFPLQMWIPDVYQGSPTIVAGMMSSIGKTAAFGAMISFFASLRVTSLPALVAIISVLTMLYGNVLALMQTDIKRLLAYSSIAHAGYILIGFIVLNPTATQGIVFYLSAYILMQLGSFIGVGVIEELPSFKESISGATSIESYKGLGKTNPAIASLLSVFLFSLAGIPPFAGFWGKYYIFYAAIQNGYVWIAVTGVMLSLVGVYYYIKVVLYMWFHEPVPGAKRKPLRKGFAFVAAAISTAALFLIGFYPGTILNIIKTIS